MTKMMKKFLTEWYEWAKDGLTHPVFEDRVGLCTSLSRWAVANGCNSYDKERLQAELKNMFFNQGLDELYPFGSENYRKDQKYGEQHKNPKRLAWVETQLGVE
jgi:hypothetical protein